MNTKQKSKKFLEKLLKEVESIERPTSMADFAPSDNKPVSLDQAIDRYFIQYERESIPTSEMFEGNIRNLVGYLLEQDIGEVEAEDPAAEEENIEPDADLDLDFGNEEPTEKTEEEPEQPVINTPQINLQDFTRSVARLANNSQSLIDFKTLILNRAESYIKNNYNERTAREMMDILDKQWDLRPESSETSSEQPNEYPQSYTAVTGPLGG